MPGDIHSSDEHLVSSLLRGDEHAFLVLYRSCSGPVFRFALYMTGDHHSAEEITQETFTFLLTNAAAYDARRGSLLAWLLGVARNGVRRLLAARGDSPEEESGAEIPDETDLFQDFARRELIQAVRSTIETLPPSLREIVILCELQELDYKDAAAILACPIGTVRSRLNRARALLLSKLKTRCLA